MITARLFRLYRLPSPASISTAASASSAISSTKILEPTLRRVAVSGNEICHGTFAIATATSGPFTTSWTRYCAYSTDKSGDGPAECETAPQTDISTPPAEEVMAAADPPPVDPQCDEESRATTSTAADSPDQLGNEVSSVELSSDGQSDSVSLPASETDSSPAEPIADAGTVTELVEADNTVEAAVEATVESNADAVIQDTVEPVPLSPTSPPSAAPSGGLHVHVLSDRALIRVEGTDTQALLQGLVTQDLDLLNQSRSVYAMMLNLQGRVLYDVIIYNVSSPLSEVQKYLVECDAAVASDIVSHLKKYKLRKSCDIVNVSDVFEVSSVRPTTERMANLSSLPRQSEFAEAFDPILIACRDPRLKDLGWRLISGKGFDVSEALGGGAVVRPLVEYREQRYKLGVAEGILDLEPGKTFPLESNLVFLNGVSFSKGCYLGQELTARTHHTGVIRKRVMPLILSTPISPESGPFPGNLILNTAGKDAGKFRDAVGVHGIGLIRVNMSGGRLIVVGKGKESECYARMPHWWPMDDPAAVLGDEGEEELVDDSVAGQHQESAQNSS